MKRTLTVAAVLVAVVLAVGVLAGSVLAAPPNPQASPTPGVPGTGPGWMRGFGRGGMSWAGIEDEVLTLLGLTREQLIAERQAGKSLVQIAASKGISEQQLVDAILAAKRADLDQAVRDGRITQQQADWMYENMQQMVPQMVNQTGSGHTGRWKGNTRATCPCCDENGQPNQPTQPSGRGRMGRGDMAPRVGGSST